MMKIAFVTDDQRTISQHFGRAAYYLIVTVEGGQIANRELIDKPSHHHKHQDDHEHQRGNLLRVSGMDHKHEEPEHGFGPDAEHRHAGMIEPIRTCEALIARGMGRGAYAALQAAGVRPIVTDFILIEDALQAYLSGGIVNHTEKLH